MVENDYAYFYDRLTENFRYSAKSVRFIQMSNFLVEMLYYCLYPLCLTYIFFCERDFFLKALLVPGISFLAVSAIRKVIKRKRPYERWFIQPLIRKDSSKDSMPSRHVFSATIISMLIMKMVPLLGIVLLLVSVFGAVIRVVGGVHYPTDTAAAYILGLLFGLLFFI